MRYKIWITLVHLKVISWSFMPIFLYIVDILLFQVLSCPCSVMKMYEADLSYSLGSLPLCPVEDVFLCRLIQKDSIEVRSNGEIIHYVEEALTLRQSSTRDLLKLLEDTIDAQRERTYSIAQDLHGKSTSEGQNFLMLFNCRVILTFLFVNDRIQICIFPLIINVGLFEEICLTFL